MQNNKEKIEPPTFVFFFISDKISINTRWWRGKILKSYLHYIVYQVACLYWLYQEKATSLETLQPIDLKWNREAMWLLHLVFSYLERSYLYFPHMAFAFAISSYQLLSKQMYKTRTHSIIMKFRFDSVHTLSDRNYM